MKVKVSRTTRPEPGHTLGFIAETLFAYVELSVKNVHALINMRPEQIAPMHISEGEDRKWTVKNPLMFHTIASGMCFRGRFKRENPELIVLVDLMKDHLTDDWEFSWSTMDDLQLEIFSDDEDAACKVVVPQEEPS